MSGAITTSCVACLHLKIVFATTSLQAPTKRPTHGILYLLFLASSLLQDSCQIILNPLRVDPRDKPTAAEQNHTSAPGRCKIPETKRHSVSRQSRRFRPRHPLQAFSTTRHQHLRPPYCCSLHRILADRQTPTRPVSL